MNGNLISLLSYLHSTHSCSPQSSLADLDRFCLGCLWWVDYLIDFCGSTLGFFINMIMVELMTTWSSNQSWR